MFGKNDLHVVAKQVKGFWAFPPMCHSHIELVFVINGTIDMSIDGKNHTLMPGELSVCFPYLIHSYEESPEAEAVILMFAPEAAGEFSHKLRHAKPQNPFVEPSQETLSLLKQILVHSSDEGKEADMLRKAYLGALLGELLLNMPLEPVREMDTDTIQRLLTYCQEHYRENLSVTAVATALNVSESYIAKLFSASLGCSFRKYINRLRITEVKKLLRSSNKTIVDIMLECGFNNQSSFNRVFYEEIGITPREYRQSGLNR